MKGQKVKRIRQELRMTQAELARQIGVTRLAVSHWESGFRKPSLLAIKAVEMLKKLSSPDRFTEILQREARETFDRINQQCFGGELKGKYQIIFSKQMKTTKGTALPQKKTIFLSMAGLGESGWKGAEETLKHEMVHCWLYEKHRPWGHNREFKSKLKTIISALST